ncbi:LiaI-LiaF-like domain-containing protein [Evansella clarkii]|jgi:uncharacterized membrane protein|uniref:LiaI-LiaF-like domain-containing protein n=1 Tax=Evansella clarkii TaxID=79879 RepID=UPI0009972172|nr:DUF5668 domain-containing protein [Evansella clarkii]
MNRKNSLPGLLLIAAGLYFLLNQFNISVPYSDVLFTWQSVLLFIGLIMSWNGFSNRDDNKMFLGITLLGLGVYFHGVMTFGSWSYHWGFFTFIAGAAFFMKYFVNKREGLVPAVILIAVSLYALYSGQVMNYLRSTIAGFESFWPFILIILGVYLLFFRKK